MATTREIRRRIRGVRSTGQIAKAMETVAASKMQRAQAQTLASRPYAEKALFVLRSLARQLHSGGGLLHPLLTQRPVKRVAIILYTADRGLCGAFNSNTIRKAVEFTKNQDRPVSFITVGRKGRDFLMRYGFQIGAESPPIPDRPTLLDVLPVARVAIDDYLAGKWDTVYLAYTRFINTLVQRPTITRLLPLEPVWETQAPASVDYIYEPDPRTILDQVLPRFT
jgi:F-type H+-transporting ATPase subunit gamma